MRSPNKNRSRNKSNRKNVGNVINRVFESAGPEGKVRGTPQQVIEKYQTLARDSQLAGDPVAAENFLQHAEHYVRLLAEANAQMEAQNQQRREQEQAQKEASDDGSAAEASAEGEDVAQADAQEDSTLVSTPEAAQPYARARRRRSRPNGELSVAEDAAPLAEATENAQPEDALLSDAPAKQVMPESS